MLLILEVQLIKIKPNVSLIKGLYKQHDAIDKLNKLIKLVSFEFVTGKSFWQAQYNSLKKQDSVHYLLLLTY